MMSNMHFESSRLILYFKQHIKATIEECGTEQTAKVLGLSSQALELFLADFEESLNLPEPLPEDIDVEDLIELDNCDVAPEDAYQTFSTDFKK